MKNWKSTMAFFVFIAAYVYTITKGMGADVLEITGYVALWSSLFMMLRSEITGDLLVKIIDTFGNKFSNTDKGK